MVEYLWPSGRVRDRSMNTSLATCRSQALKQRFLCRSTCGPIKALFVSIKQERRSSIHDQRNPSVDKSHTTAAGSVPSAKPSVGQVSQAPTDLFPQSPGPARHAQNHQQPLHDPFTTHLRADRWNLNVSGNELPSSQPIPFTSQKSSTGEAKR